MKVSKTGFYLILIFLVALILRIIAAYHVAIGTDEMIYSVIPLNIISAGRLSTIEQAPVYFYLTDLGYKVTGGLSLLSGRLPSILFGSFAVLLVFLIAQELFENKKISLLSAFFAALSGYILRFSQEMDMAAFFFGLFSFLFFIKGLKGKLNSFYYSVIFLSIAILIKPILLLFAPAYVLIFLIHGYNHHQGLLFKKDGKIHTNKKTLTVIVFSLLVAMLLVSPVLIYNYLLYKDSGRTDYYFSVLAGVGDNNLFKGQEAESWTTARLVNTLKITLHNFIQFDLLLLILGALGLVLAFQKEKSSRYYISLLMLSVFFLFLYIAGKMSGANHLLWIPLVLSIFAGYAAWNLKEKIQNRFQFKHVLTVLVVLSMIISFISLKQIIPQRETSIAIALEKYGRENFPEDALVIVDPRIYRGILAWSINQKHYLEGTDFPQLVEILSHSSAPTKNIPLYYIECGPGTNCGWKPEDYQRINGFGEQLSSFFRNQTQKLGEIKAIDTFVIYKGTINAPFSAYELVDRTHSFWYTPVGWKYTENAVDNYATDTFAKKSLHYIGLLILYFDVLIALASLMLVLRLLWKQYD